MVTINGKFGSYGFPGSVSNRFFLVSCKKHKEMTQKSTFEQVMKQYVFKGNHYPIYLAGGVVPEYFSTSAMAYPFSAIESRVHET